MRLASTIPKNFSGTPLARDKREALKALADEIANEWAHTAPMTDRDIAIREGLERAHRIALRHLAALGEPSHG